MIMDHFKVKADTSLETLVLLPHPFPHYSWKDQRTCGTCGKTNLKQSFATALILTHPGPSLPFKIERNDGNYSLSAPVLQSFFLEDTRPYEKCGRMLGWCRIYVKCIQTDHKNLAYLKIAKLQSNQVGSVLLQGLFSSLN